jgi:transposase
LSANLRHQKSPHRFEDSRSGDCVARHLAGFAGILQVDGYAAYTQLAKAKIRSNEGMALAGCLTARRDRSAAIVADLFKLWETELPRISGKSKLAEAIRYATSRREILGRFLLDGRIKIDSNIVERAIRPQTITRKNALFAGSNWRWQDVGNHRHPSADGKNERRRSARRADADARAHRQQVADLPDR